VLLPSTLPWCRGVLAQAESTGVVAGVEGQYTGSRLFWEPLSHVGGEGLAFAIGPDAAHSISGILAGDEPVLYVVGDGPLFLGDSHAG
jgi:hypothetical protein